MAPSAPIPRTPKARLARQAVVFAVMLVIAIGGCGAGALIANHVHEGTVMGVVIFGGILEILLGIVGFIGLLVTAIQAIFQPRAGNSFPPPAAPPPPSSIPPPGPERSPDQRPDQP